MHKDPVETLQEVRTYSRPELRAAINMVQVLSQGRPNDAASASAILDQLEELVWRISNLKRVPRYVRRHAQNVLEAMIR